MAGTWLLLVGAPYLYWFADRYRAGDLTPTKLVLAISGLLFVSLMVRFIPAIFSQPEEIPDKDASLPQPEGPAKPRLRIL